MAGTDFVPKYTRTNVMVGMAALFIQPYDPEVIDFSTLLPPDTQALGTPWTDPWVAVGATSEGVTLRQSRDTQDIMIEEQSNPIEKRVTSSSPQVELSLSEDTLQTMKWSWGGGTIVTTAATASEFGYSDLTISEELEHFMLGLESKNPAGMPRRVILGDVVSTGEVETAYRRADSQRLYPCVFSLLTPVTKMKVHDITSAPTG